MATVAVYPRLGTEYDDAAGVPITSAGAIVDVSKYILDALKRGYLLDWDPLDIFQPDDRTGIPTGENSSTLQNQAALIAAAVSVGTDAVEVLGCSAAGDRGGCLYKRITSNFPPVGVGGEMVGTVTAGDGSIWVYVPDSRGVNVRAFGALGEDSTAEENTRGIQNALIFDMYYAHTGRTYIPSGFYDINDTIHLGYGTSYTSTTLEGEGMMFSAELPFGGTALRVSFSDRPIIACQGARLARIKDIALLGPNKDYVYAELLAQAGSSVDDSVLSNWIGPGMSANCNSRYAPFAGVAIDPYSGAQPGTAYPAVTYPAFLGAVSQYGKNFSTDVELDHVYIGGVVVPVAVQPCDADGNGDFISLRECLFEANVYGFVSVGNTQSRLLSADKCLGTVFHTGIANSTHGKQDGKVASEWVNCQFSNCIQWIDLPDASYAGPVKFQNCYGEAVYKIGSYGSNNASNQPITFDGCIFSFDLQDRDELRGVPATTFALASSVASFKDCFFGAFDSLLMFSGPPKWYSFYGCQSYPLSARSNAYEKVGHNFTCGIMLGITSSDTVWPRDFSVKLVSRYDLVAGTDLGTDIVSTPTSSARTLGVPAWVAKVHPQSHPEYRRDAPTPWVIALAKSGMSLSVTNRTLTISSFVYDTYQNIFGGMPGDVIYDDDSKTVFFIRSYSAGTIIAEAQNNRLGTGLKTSFSTTVGNLYFGNARIYLPAAYLRGTFSTGSATVSSVGRADNYGGILSTWIANGDRVYIGNGQTDASFGASDAATLVSSVTNGTPGSFALGANPAFSATRDLGFMIRAAPSNV
jgi:hypothetical protein